MRNLTHILVSAGAETFLLRNTMTFHTGSVFYKKTGILIVF